jgi:hypothetical protein
MLDKIKQVFLKSIPSTSGKFNIDKTDFAKVVRSAILLGAATAGQEIVSYLQPDMFGDHKTLATIILAMSADFLMRYIRENGTNTKSPS